MKILNLTCLFLAVSCLQVTAQQVIENGELKVEQEFYSGDILYSANKEYLLSLTASGDLWLVNSDWDFLWKSNSAKKKCSRSVLRLQTDGNLCIYDISDTNTEKFIWCNLVDQEVKKLVLSDDGYLFCRANNGQVVWKMPNL